MTTKLLQFVNQKKEMPKKRTGSIRLKDFNEIYKNFNKVEAKNQAGRCSQCGIPFCQVHCPLQNNIPDWLKLAAEDRLEEAFEVSQSTNNFPEICGSICPQDRLCEGNCVIEKGFESVTIGRVEKHITDTAWEKGWVKPVKPIKEINKSVGIIGSGPAGLAAAEQLRKKGYKIEIYDRYDRPGGLLIYGIPNFKLEKYAVVRRTEVLKKSGIIFHNNFEVGKTKSFNFLKKKHDAILIATGVYKARELDMPEINSKGVIPALDFLIASNKKGLGDTVDRFSNGELNAQNKNVVVIGGGDTAMDCVRTAIRQNAKSVKCLYRRNKENMPGSLREVFHAEEEGIEFLWLSMPKKIILENNEIKIDVAKVILDKKDSSGRQEPKLSNNSYSINADLVIKALGFNPEDLPNLFNYPNLKVTSWGTIKVNHETMMTNEPGIFAAGDIVRGASLVVWAIKDGRDAADSIDKFLIKKNNFVKESINF
ncbi:MAG: Glutamate synthase [NADPH] small chain [Alphaproteobacteria bacterium MarineAlpha6_Bin6]|nr:MAG: Glutamate synthase [NADPH] small chain [Alphaproteobacteria bacterium MarineAlpha6_Bin6]PPR33979.1 MAG: Glutamate synthase [NADPH] small chain [Alphaproteobacteria bacterium MarineAlpha6_Bin5]|tara:strand:- start:1764 stop:3203 length:1440 start_codon:yes stop_codon:yes gene_type:complete